MSVTAALIGLGGTILGAGVSGLINRSNRNSQESINNYNARVQKEINQQNIDFQRSMTQQQWERDDNAFQRQVADLEAAGLSPLAISGSGAGVSPVVNSPNLQANQAYPYLAPQFDMNSYIQSFIRAREADDKHEEVQSKINYRSSYLSQREEEIGIKLQNLNFQDKKLEQEKDLTLKSLELQTNIFEHTKRQDLSELDLKRFCAKSEYAAKTYLKNMPSDTPQKPFIINNVSDLEKYEVALDNYYNHYSIWAETSSTAGYVADANNQGKGGNGGIGGNGLNLTVGGHVNSGEFHAEAKDKNQIEKESFAAYCAKNKVYYPIPTFRSAF